MARTTERRLDYRELAVMTQADRDAWGESQYIWRHRLALDRRHVGAVENINPKHALRGRMIDRLARYHGYDPDEARIIMGLVPATIQRALSPSTRTQESMRHVLEAIRSYGYTYEEES